MTTRRTTVTWGLVLGVPVLVGLAGALLLISAQDDLPRQVATHWGPDGPDDFAARSTAIWLAGLLPLIGAVAGALLLTLHRGAASVRRAAVTSATGMAAFIGTLVTGSTLRQRGLSDAAEAGGVEPVLLAALLVGALVAAGAAALVRRDPQAAIASGAPSGAEPFPLAPGERAVWSARTSTSPVALGLLVLALAPVGAFALMGTAPIFFLLVLVVLIAAILLTMSARVWVDERGLTVRSPLGKPSHRIPLEQVAGAREVAVNPFTEFGGWGYRIGRGGQAGLVLRKGPALEVTRGDGSRFVVTVDGAGDAAALLTALAARTRS